MDNRIFITQFLKSTLKPFAMFLKNVIVLLIAITSSISQAAVLYAGANPVSPKELISIPANAYVSKP